MTAGPAAVAAGGGRPAAPSRVVATGSASTSCAASAGSSTRNPSALRLHGVRGHRAVHGVDELADDVQPDPGARGTARVHVRAVEQVEDRGELVLGQAGAVVLDADHDMALGGVRGDAHRLPVAVLRRVGQQVDEDLAQGRLVAGDRGQGRREIHRDLEAGEPPAHLGDDGGHEPLHEHGLRADLDEAVLGARQDEQVLGDAVQPVGLFLDVLDQRLQLVAARLLREQLRGAVDGGHRRPQLVRHDAHERVAEDLPLLELGDRRLELQAGGTFRRVGDRLLLDGRVQPARGPHEDDDRDGGAAEDRDELQDERRGRRTERLRCRPLLEDDPAGARHRGEAEQLVGVPVRSRRGAQHAAVVVVAHVVERKVGARPARGRRPGAVPTMTCPSWSTMTTSAPPANRRLSAAMPSGPSRIPLATAPFTSPSAP